MFPFVIAGRLAGSFSSLKNESYEIYFFFPFHHIGGAEKLHYQIAQIFSGKKAIIYFTRKSQKASFMEEFRKTGFTIRDISIYTDNKWIYPVNFFFRGLISYFINSQNQPPIIFNGQSNFGYKISPWISKSIPQLDLIHALCSFSIIRIPFLEFYSRSITVSREIIEKHEVLYKRYQLPESLTKNIEYINYGIDLPPRCTAESTNEKLNVLYVGRGSLEKRIELIAAIAKEMSGINKNVQFNFLGDVKSFIPASLLTYCNLLGAITDAAVVDKIYRDNQVLIVCSSTESGPLVAMEAMARGLAVVSTPVGIINEHVVSGKNGFVFSSVKDETVIIKEALKYLTEVEKKPALLKQIGDNNITYAYENFSIEIFKAHYRELFKKYSPLVLVENNAEVFPI